MGNAAFHTGGEAGPAETVYLGVFRREALERQGGYNEEFIRAQDWELNFRIREAGGLIWFSPELRVSYRPAAERAGRSPSSTRTTAAGAASSPATTRAPSTCATSPRRPPCARSRRASWSGAALTPLGFLVPGGYLAAIAAGSLPGRQGAAR